MKQKKTPNIQSNKELASRLKATRKELNLTLKEVSAQTGIAYSSISEIESSKRTPSITYLSWLSSEHNISLDWLFSGRGTMFASEIDIKLNYGEYNEHIKKLISLIGSDPLFR